jgi:hypothetical protein
VQWRCCPAWVHCVEDSDDQCFVCELYSASLCVCPRVCVGVWEREKERERESTCVCVCVAVVTVRRTTKADAIYIYCSRFRVNAHRRSCISGRDASEKESGSVPDTSLQCHSSHRHHHPHPVEVEEEEVVVVVWQGLRLVVVRLGLPVPVHRPAASSPMGSTARV